MGEAFRQAWQDLFGRVDGPMSFRLIIQPVVATFLAIRAVPGNPWLTSLVQSRRAAT